MKRVVVELHVVTGLLFCRFGQLNEHFGCERYTEVNHILKRLKNPFNKVKYIVEAIITTI